MRIPRLLPACLLALTLLAGTAAATIVLRVTVEDLADKATAIASGEVTEVTARWTDDRATINTYVRIRVDKTMKGQASGVIEVTCPGGAVGEKRVAVEGVPEFRVGEQVFVFLWKNKRGDLLPLGLNQGKFRIEKNADTGELMAKNSLKGLCFARRGALEKASHDKPDRLTLADLERRVRERLEKNAKAESEEKTAEEKPEGEAKQADEAAKPEHAGRPEQSEAGSTEPKESGDHASTAPTAEEEAPEKKEPGEKPKAEEADKPEPDTKKPEEETPPGRR